MTNRFILLTLSWYIVMSSALRSMFASDVFTTTMGFAIGAGDSWALAFPRMHWWYGQRENEMEGGAGVEQGKIVLSETGNGGGITEPAISTQSDNEMHMEGGSGKEHGKNVLSVMGHGGGITESAEPGISIESNKKIEGGSGSEQHG